MNCKLDDLEPSFYDMSPSEPSSKRRRLDTQPQQHHYQQQQIQPCPTDQITNMADIWRPYLHPNEYCDNMLPQIKLDNSLFPEPMTPQDNLISFMLKGPEEPNNHIIRDSQKLLANMNMSSGLQLTKLWKRFLVEFYWYCQSFDERELSEQHFAFFDRSALNKRQINC